MTDPLDKNFLSRHGTILLVASQAILYPSQSLPATRGSRTDYRHCHPPASFAKNPTMAKSSKQIQQEITNKIIESLKQGTIPRREP